MLERLIPDILDLGPKPHLDPSDDSKVGRDCNLERTTYTRYYMHWDMRKINILC